MMLRTISKGSNAVGPVARIAARSILATPQNSALVQKWTIRQKHTLRTTNIQTVNQKRPFRPLNNQPERGIQWLVGTRTLMTAARTACAKCNRDHGKIKYV